jgi:hypothetical protein
MLPQNKVKVDDTRIRSPHNFFFNKEIIREQILKENPNLACDPEKLKLKILKRIDTMKVIDSSYFLG